MPKLTIEQQNSAILRVIAQLAQGAALIDVMRLLPFALPRRTLQRRLAALVASGRLLTVGTHRGVRYVVAPTDRSQPPVAADVAAGYPLLSKAGESVRGHVRQPVQARSPVGYRRGFLDSYRPNETVYLPDALRERLRRVGASSTTEDRPAGSYARRILDRLLIDLAWNSSRLEGNTYSLLETERLLALGELADGRAAFEAQMILNHKAAIEFLVECAEDVGFNRYTILNLHALLADNLLGDPQACGRLRSIPVGIAQTAYQPLGIPQLIDECFRQILDTAETIRDPLEQAFFAMVQLPYPQPFDDVNKRVSRLAANIPLVRHNLCPLSFVDVPEGAYVDAVLGVYELNRVELLRDVFVWAYEHSAARYAEVRRSLGEPDPFRVRHRSAIVARVAEVVRARMDKKAATLAIQQWAARMIGSEDRARFVEVVETELTGLHEGNIARYRLRPAEHAAWQQGWR